MARHQHGIFAEGTRSHHHLEFVLHDGVSAAQVAEALVGVRAANADGRTAGGTNLVIGVGPALWSQIDPEARTLDLRPFPGYRNEVTGLHAPTSQRDLWIWVHGPSTDVVIDVVRAVTAALHLVARLELDLTGFVYHDSRDLTGFIDGTANPPVDDAAEVATVPADQPGAGASFAMTMQFVHDLAAFEALPETEQEHVFGRTKPDGTNLGAAKPVDAHIARAEVADDDGEELVVYRRSVPWATAAAQGLHFVSFGADLDRFDLQLRHMYGLIDDGVTDRLLGFTTPMTGSFWLCPSVDDLDAIAPVPDDEDE